MGDGERLSVRLSPDTIVLLTELVSRKQYSTEAEAVQEAVRLLIESKFTAEEIPDILKKHKEIRVFDLNEFTSDGEDVSTILGNVIDRGLESERKG